MSFDSIREIGCKHIFASAGVRELILGLSAQKMIGSIFSRHSNSHCPAIKIDDGWLLLKNEWGLRIEEITVDLCLSL